jgi:hypothetical protein
MVNLGKHFVVLNPELGKIDDATEMPDALECPVDEEISVFKRSQKVNPLKFQFRQFSSFSGYLIDLFSYISVYITLPLKLFLFLFISPDL